ncbi:hypothetical protein BGZ95_004294 [Linnemannia exigua]|uniref:F-box domain-containing protein n=1 Tax=Linnemannia exigua TaxID=604196 RepID=A0AAD4DHV5_9FUNG|nr:hypothetical protein BGZ95_004294 [Linnemannia exigua]
MRCQLHPLELPHILDAIFAFLDPYPLRHNVRLVNKQWRAIAEQHLELISTVNDWNPAHTEDELVQFLDTLSNRTLLKISQQGQPDMHRGRSLIGRLDTLRNRGSNNSIRIRALHLDNVPTGEPWIFVSLFPKLGPFLTTIRISGALWTTGRGDRYHPLPLGVILFRCPQLRHLFISTTEGRCDIGHNTNPPGPGPSSDPTDLGTLQLEEVEVFNMYIPQLILEAVITHSPRLQILRLVGMCGIENSNLVLEGASTRTQIVDLASESCPELQIFHYSTRWHRLAKDDVIGFTSLTRHQGQYSGILHRIHLTSPDDVVGQLGDLTLCNNHVGEQNATTTHTLSLYSYCMHRAIAPSLQPIVNMVTTLEILPTSRPPHSLDVSVDFTHTLHGFLCSSPLLLHLKAPLVRFHSALLDLRGELNLEGHYQALPAVPYYRPWQQWAQKKIWVCRRLVTLHIYSSGEYIRDAEEDARILFGYISRICPLLQDLAIQHQHLCVRLEGGLCLLSRLNHLQRLSIVSSGNNSGFTKADLLWMQKSPPSTRDLPRFREPKERHTGYRRQLGQLLQRSITALARADPHRVQEMHRLYLKAKDPDQQLTLEDMDGVGSVADLEAWRQFSQGYKIESRPGRINEQEGEDGAETAPTEQVKPPYCLPSLKYFAFYRYQVPVVKQRKNRVHRQEDLDALDQALWDEIKDIRPGVEIKCNRGLYYNAIYYIGIHGNPTHLSSYGKPYVDV